MLQMLDLTYISWLTDFDDIYESMSARVMKLGGMMRLVMNIRINVTDAGFDLLFTVE